MKVKKIRVKLKTKVGLPPKKGRKGCYYVPRKLKEVTCAEKRGESKVLCVHLPVIGHGLTRALGFKRGRRDPACSTNSRSRGD